MTGMITSQRIAFLEKYLKRDDVVEIIINKEGEVLLELTNGDWLKQRDKKVTLNALRDLGEILANERGVEFGVNSPIYSGRLPHYGYRIQLNMFSHVESGVSLAIRVAQAKRVPLESYMSAREAARLIELIQQGKTMLIIAGTGCGKTTLLNSMLCHIPSDNRIITIEDTRELVIPHDNCTSFVIAKNGTDAAQLGYKEMIDSSLRLRPDRILLGEITVDNVMPFLNISSSGHRGSISTLHAHTPDEAVNKLFINAAMSGSDIKEDVMSRLVRDCIDVFVMIEKRIENGKRIFTARFEEMEH
jgi:type IV secretion system protein VirB11